MLDYATGVSAVGIDYSHAKDIFQRISSNIQSVIKGKPQTIKLLLAAFFFLQEAMSCSRIYLGRGRLR